MAFFTSPTSYRLNGVVATDYGPSIVSRAVSLGLGVVTRDNGHDSHPALGHLILLVFEAVLEVVCVSLPGYIVAQQGMFDQDQQKFVANLNVALFTPCLSM
jgi:auxin efflux carrier family protein